MQVSPFWWATLRFQFNISCDISQRALIPKIIRRLEIDAQISSERKNAIKGGLCFSFSVQFGIHAAHDQLFYWFDALQKTAQWDGLVASLRTNDDLSKKTALVACDVTRSQATQPVSDISIIRQSCFLKSDFFLPQYQLKKYAAFVVKHMSREQFETLLNLPFFQAKESVCLLSTLQHTCAIAQYESGWLFYDPNDLQGPLYFKTIPELYDHVLRKILLLNELIVKFCTWNLDIIRNSLTPQAQLLNVNGLFSRIVIDCVGLTVISEQAPEQLEQLLVLAQKDENIRNAIADALSVKNVVGLTALSMMACRAPEQLIFVLKLTQMDEKFRVAVIDTLSKGQLPSRTTLKNIESFASTKIYNAFVKLQEQAAPRFF